MTLSPGTRKKLYTFIDSHYDTEELRTLCWFISVEYDSLRGEGKDAKARELISHAERRGSLDSLLRQLEKDRPTPFQKAGLASWSEQIETGIGEVFDSQTKTPDRQPPSSEKSEENPYFFGPLVKNPAMFFGREAELKALCARLRNMQSTSVIGERRIGKSSLLYQLTLTLNNELGSNFIPLYIDLLDARYQTPAGFVSTIAKALNKTMDGFLNVSGVTDMARFTELMEPLSKTGMHPVLCLDEFEELLQNPEKFNNDFLEALRSLGGHSKLAMVTASRIPLIHLIEENEWASPFYNIFSQLDLGLLEPDEAKALRRVPFERARIELGYEDEALIQELGGRHPFFLQMACYHLYDTLTEPSDRRAEIVRERFNHDTEYHFERLWNHLDVGEQAALSEVIAGTAPDEETESTLKRLARVGIVEKDGGSWKLFSQAFTKSVQSRLVQVETITPELEEAEVVVASPPSQLLLYTGVAIAVVIFAALISALLPTEGILSTVIIAAVILPFALVGAGKLTGQEFTALLGKLVGARDSDD